MPEVVNPLKGKNAAQLTEMLREKSKELNGIFEEHTVEVEGQKTYDFTVEQIEDVRKRNDELTDIGKALDAQREVEKIASDAKSAADHAEQSVKRPPFAMRPQDADGLRDDRGPRKTLGELFTETKQYRAARESGFGADTRFGAEVEHDVKTTMTRAAGFAPANDRTDIVVPFALRRVVIQDYIPETPTDLDSIRFMEETTFTNAAVETAENAAIPESALAYTERSQAVELIGTYIPVTEQQLEVPEFTQAIIDNRLVTMYRLREESQLLNGDGISPNILGFLNKSGLQTQAKGADPIPDAWYKLITKLRGGGGAGFVEPSLIITHPNDWQEVRLLKDANGNYLWGSPAEAGPERMWGKPVVPTTAISEGTGLTGDFMLFSQLYRKRQIRVEVGLINDDFIKVKQTIRVTGRISLVIYRAAAFGTATGI
jgi:HK97 family phage major capsid protein